MILIESPLKYIHLYIYIYMYTYITREKTNIYIYIYIQLSRIVGRQLGMVGSGFGLNRTAHWGQNMCCLCFYKSVGISKLANHIQCYD